MGFLDFLPPFIGKSGLCGKFRPAANGRTHLVHNRGGPPAYHEGNDIDVSTFGWQIAIMVKTQVQIPDALFREAKRIAAENEMSFAEVVRRGLEEIIRHHPPGRADPETWRLPQAFDLGAPLAPEDEWTALCHD